jgi:hypothetical protein
MSGGHFNYMDRTLKNEMFDCNYDNKRGKSNPFEDQLISELAFDLFDLIYSLDYYKSGDTSEEDYLKDKAEFKKKWLKNTNDTIKKVIEEQFTLLKNDFLS